MPRTKYADQEGEDTYASGQESLKKEMSGSESLRELRTRLNRRDTEHHDMMVPRGEDDTWISKYYRSGVKKLEDRNRERRGR